MKTLTQPSPFLQRARVKLIADAYIARLDEGQRVRLAGMNDGQLMVIAKSLARGRR